MSVVFKIPVFNLFLQRKNIIIEKKYFYPNIIISLGSDCHPAYVLNKLGIRRQSLPFDWLNTEDIEGINFVVDNLINDFKYFLSELELNERGYLISKKYRFTEFMHEKGLNQNADSKAKFIRRIERFKNLVKNQKCDFLYNITSLSCKSEEDVKYFVNSVQKFINEIKNDDKLHIYIRFEDSYNENSEICRKLQSELEKLDKIYVSNYIRDTKNFGIWGDQNKYYYLLKGLNLRVKFNNFHIYIK